MGEEKLLTVREVSVLLGVSEKEVMDLAENGTIPAYKVGGVYLRFRNDQVQEYRKSHRSHTSKRFKENPARDRIRDFFYFNDFYILSAVLIFLLLMVILRG